jgi:hypothetical protein
LPVIIAEYGWPAPARSSLKIIPSGARYPPPSAYATPLESVVGKCSVMVSNGRIGTRVSNETLNAVNAPAPEWTGCALADTILLITEICTAFVLPAKMLLEEVASPVVPAPSTTDPFGTVSVYITAASSSRKYKLLAKMVITLSLKATNGPFVGISSTSPRSV